MKIIIAGAGEVGFHLAKLLSFESQDITLIDNNQSILNMAENQLDIKTIEGNSASYGGGIHIQSNDQSNVYINSFEINSNNSFFIK